MATQQFGKYQVTEATNWSGLTTGNHLYNFFGGDPQRLTDVTIRMLAASNLNNLDTMLMSLPVKQVENDADFTWQLIGNDDKNVALLYAYTNTSTQTAITSGDNNVGANGVRIYLVFPEAYFTDVNVIVGEKNEIYQFRILAEPTRTAGGWVYETQLMGENTDGVPGEELVSGKRFSKEFSPVERELSIKGGEVHFNTPIDMRQSFTTLRMEHKVPGSMFNKRVGTAIEGRDANDKLHRFNTWMYYAEWQLERQWSQEKARACMYSRSNRSADGTYHDKGKSGFMIKQGSGIREQMEVSNTSVYSTFNLDSMVSIMSDMSEGSIDMKNRTFLVKTGERGAIQFSKSVTADSAGWVALRGDNPANIFRTTSPLHQNSLSAGYQFTEWLAPNNIKVRLEVDSYYDDKVRNKQLHPNGGVAESYRYDILYMGSEDQPNIQKVMHNNSEHFGYKAGFRNPWTGEANNQHMGHMEDSAIYTKYGSFAVVVLDPSRTASMVPDLLV